MKKSPPKYHNRHIDKIGESFTTFLESQGHKVIDVTPKTKGWEKEARRLFNPYAEEIGFEERDWEIFLKRMGDVFEEALQQQKKEIRDDDREEELWSEGVKEGRRQMKKEMVEKINKLQKACSKADGTIDGLTALHELLEEL